MHKPIYASGFLYHLATQQILLQQTSTHADPIASWSMFSGKSQQEEDASTLFQRVIREELHINLEIKNILPVYDYVRDIHNTVHYILYAEVPTLYTFPSPSGNTLKCSWFTYKLTTKLQLDDQTKQDVIVSERVIKAQARTNEPEIVSPHTHPNSSLFR